MFACCPADQPLVAQVYSQAPAEQLAPPQDAQAQILQLPEEVRSGFAHVLAALTGSKARSLLE
jgi:hypothetical protein